MTDTDSEFVVAAIALSHVTRRLLARPKVIQVLTITDIADDLVDEWQYAHDVLFAARLARLSPDRQPEVEKQAKRTCPTCDDTGEVLTNYSTPPVIPCPDCKNGT